jgi:ParB/RepB/Spo0J family partition protein
MQELHELPVESLVLPRDNVRRHIGDVDELAASIVEVGLLEPVIVTPLGKNGGKGSANGSAKYLIVAGSRRLIAAKKAKVKTLPAIVRKFDEKERVLAMAIENLQREDLTVLEEAGAYSRLTELGMTEREVAKRTGRAQSHVHKRMSLLGLPEDAQKLIDDGKLSVTHALEFARLVKWPDRLKRVWKESGKGQYGNVSWTVDREVREATGRENAVKEVAKVKAEGLTYLEPKTDRFGGVFPPDKTRELVRYGEKIVDPKKHAKLECHAVTVHPVTGERAELCTKPDSHKEYAAFDKKHHLVKNGREVAAGPGNRPGMTKAEKERQAKREAEAKKSRDHASAMSKAKHERWQFVRKLLGKRVSKPLAFEELVFASIEQLQSEPIKTAAKLLALEPAKDTSSYEGTSFVAALRNLAGKSENDLHRVGLAIAWACQEAAINQSWSKWGDREKDYLGVLEEQGYTVSAAEKRELAGRAPKSGY